MAKQIQSGDVRFGHLVDPITGDLVAASLTFDDRGVIVERPVIDDAEDLFAGGMGDLDDSVGPLHYVDSDGRLVLTQSQVISHRMTSRGVAAERIRCDRAIVSPSLHDFAKVDGMDSEIDGLATWADMSAVSQSIEHVGDHFAAVLRAENPDATEIGGEFGTSIHTSFTHHPDPVGNVFSISDVVSLRTTTAELRDWQEHVAVHRMFQDLLSLAFGKPAGAKMRSVKREDDQDRLGDGETRRWWRGVYEPQFGRVSANIKPLDRRKDQPLFRLSDCDMVAVRSWIAGFETWSRPTWIAVSTMYQSHVTVESSLLQMGVALEALGYAIELDAARCRGETTSAITSNYPTLLRTVTDDIGFEHERIFGPGGADQWRASFNAAFKGAKHADNPLPDPHVANDCRQQAMTLLRCWLAVRLGVAEQTIRDALDARR